MLSVCKNKQIAEFASPIEVMVSAVTVENATVPLPSIPDNNSDSPNRAGRFHYRIE